MIILDGRKLRDKRKQKLVRYIKEVNNVPTLAIVQVGQNPESSAYIEQKKLFGKSVGSYIVHKKFPEDVALDNLHQTIDEYNQDKKISGIIVQLPLPENFNQQEVIDWIDPAKDVDGLTSENTKKLLEGSPRFIPATAKGVATLLKEYGIDVSGKKVTVIGRSALVGRPTAEILKRQGATVTVCHRGTVDIKEKTIGADIIVVAAGHSHLVTDEYVCEGQVVIDVGINTLSGEHFDEEIPGKKYVGDVDFEKVSKKVAAISPVPGGVGPMTVLSLFENLIEAHRMACNN